MRPLSVLRLLALPLLGVFSSVTITGTAAADGPTPAPAPAFDDAAAANDFDFAMYASLQSRKGNLFFSAPSLRQALGMTYLGARGDTAKQMASVLHFQSDTGKTASAAKDEIGGWQTARGTNDLAIANRLWVHKGYPLVADFTKTASTAYGAGAEPVDFVGAPNDSRKTINGWVAQQTHDKIKDLLPPPSITSDTRLVLTNAIWFKGTWEQKFDKSATRDDAFMVDGKTRTNLPTMFATAKLGYGEAGGAKILEMRYAKSDLAMDVILPDDPNGLAKIENGMDAARFRTWTSAVQQRKVVVSLPKFQYEWGDSMKEDLLKLGMTNAFDGRADFSGMTTADHLRISDVRHKAFVAVDEAGTEAAAATAVVMTRESAVLEPPPATFTADRPFVFVIRDVKRGRILFMGRVTNPKP
jgi:serpin B